MQKFIQFRQVSKSFVEGNGRRVVLQNVDLEIAEGQLVVLLGKSGSGKSTLLHLLGGLDKPDGGEVWLDEVCLSQLTENGSAVLRQQKIGFIFQFFHLIPTLTVQQNLLLPLRLKGVVGDVAASLERVGLQARAGAYPDQLSGGEQQRVAVARALIHDPSLVLADEPTGNLDEENGLAVLELLVDLVRKQGKTLLLVTHNPEACKLADRVLTLRDGQLHEEC